MFIVNETIYKLYTINLVIYINTVNSVKQNI